MESILQALQRYMGGKQPVSPIPQENVLNTSGKMKTYQTAQNQLQQMNQVNPTVNLNRDQFINNSMQYGNVSPALLSNIAYQQKSDQSAKAVNAMPQPTQNPIAISQPITTPTPTQNPIAQIGGDIQQGVQNAINVFRPQAQAQTPPTAAQIFQQYGVAPKVGAAILQAEGGRIGSNNPGNINATDSNPNGAYNYATPQAGIAGAAQTMANLLKKAGVKSNDPNIQLKAIEQAGYAGDPSTWQRRSASQGGAGKTYKHWSDFVRATGAWSN